LTGGLDIDERRFSDSAASFGDDFLYNIFFVQKQKKVRSYLYF